MPNKIAQRRPGVMVDALAYYLGSVDDMPRSRKVMELEKSLTALEIEVRSK